MARMAPLVVASTIQPLSHTGGTASFPSSGTCQAVRPSAACSAVNVCDETTNSRPLPVVSGISGSPSTVQSSAPVAIRYATILPPSIGKYARVASYAGATVNRLLSAGVPPVTAGKGESDASCGGAAAPTVDSASRVTAQHLVVRCPRTPYNSVY